jgi:hypothetical protein
MGLLYIDDSVHDIAGFVMAACVYCKKDLTTEIGNILESEGFDPLKDEFKSGANYRHKPKMADVRSRVHLLVSDYTRFGLVIVPREDRENLGFECLLALRQFIDSNNLIGSHEIFFDQGLFPSISKAEMAVANLNFKDCNFHFEQDSKAIRGLQLADLVAHTCSIILKDKLGIGRKMVKAGENSGYDPDLDIELSFELWASLRYNFFCEKRKKVIDDPIVDYTFNVSPYGLFISAKCDSNLFNASESTFGSVYQGCIH